MSLTRRSSDRRSPNERRHDPDRRIHASIEPSRYRAPSWPEQRTQFITRFVFLFLGVLFYNIVDEIQPARWSLEQMNIAFGVYFILASLFFVHASKNLICPSRYRAAMLVDIVVVSICLLNDPYPIPPSLLVYIMVVLGNGMRYGMRLFAEALLASFASIMLVFSLRYSANGVFVSPGLIFMNLFGGIILVYTYILMGRIEASRSQLERSSNLDILTGLMNRRALQIAAERMFQRLQRGQHGFVMMFADLDKFKEVNDVHGHAAGDLVLRHFASILRGAIRSTDVAARFGGDEFVLLLEDADIGAAERVARRIQEQVNTWAAENGIDFSVTFGLGEAPVHGSSYSELLDQVDKALYKSKSSDSRGGIAYAFCPEAVPPLTQ